MVCLFSSGQQHDLPELFLPFQDAVRFGRLTQRKGMTDHRIQSAIAGKSEDYVLLVAGRASRAENVQVPATNRASPDDWYSYPYQTDAFKFEVRRVVVRVIVLRPAF